MLARQQGKARQHKNPFLVPRDGREKEQRGRERQGRAGDRTESRPALPVQVQTQSEWYGMVESRSRWWYIYGSIEQTPQAHTWCYRRPPPVSLPTSPVLLHSGREKTSW